MAAAWLLWLILAMHFDFTYRRVPNWLVLGGLAAAASSLLIQNQPFGVSVTDALMGATVGFVVLLLCYAAGWMGAGDVKFAGVVGLWVGLQPLFWIWIGASLLAGMHALLWNLLLRWPYFPRLFEALSGVPGPRHHEELKRPTRPRHIPLAAYLAISSALWMLLRNTGV